MEKSYEEQLQTIPLQCLEVRSAPVPENNQLDSIISEANIFSE